MEDTKQLAELRRQIDQIDDQIVALLNQRAQLALRARIAKGGRTVHRPQREAQILERVAKVSQGPLSAEAVQTLFHSIIFVCRSIQEVESDPEILTGLDPGFAADQA